MNCEQITFISISAHIGHIYPKTCCLRIHCKWIKLILRLDISWR